MQKQELLWERNMQQKNNKKIKRRGKGIYVSDSMVKDFSYFKLQIR